MAALAAAGGREVSLDDPAEEDDFLLSLFGLRVLSIPPFFLSGLGVRDDFIREVGSGNTGGEGMEIPLSWDKPGTFPSLPLLEDTGNDGLFGRAGRATSE